jgi:hypothetical protein
MYDRGNGVPQKGCLPCPERRSMSPFDGGNDVTRSSLRLMKHVGPHGD